MLSFGPWQPGSADAVAFRRLFKTDSIYEPQRTDDGKPEDVDAVEFHGGYLAVFRGDDVHGEEYGHRGYVLYTARPGGVFEQHTGFLELHRGKAAESAIAEATRRMFLETPCTQIVTFCPEWLPATKAMAKRFGAIPMFEVKSFANRGEEMKLAHLYGQTALQWAWRNYGEFEAVGRRWHDEVFSAIEPHHEDDPTHNAFLGLALEMGRQQPHKALAIYNAWAELAGYAAGRLIWADGEGNSFVDIGNAMVLNGPDHVLAVIPRKSCPQRPPSPQQPEPSQVPA